MTGQSRDKKRSLTVYLYVGMLLVTDCTGKTHRGDSETRIFVKSVLVNCNECGFAREYSISAAN